LGGGTGKPPKETKTLAVAVENNRNQVILKNVATPEAAGKIIDVYINGMPPFTYKAQCIYPSVGEKVSVNLDDFTEKNGTRFNPRSHAVTEVWVGGAGYDYKAFGK
jgi:hypothetical protein